jgi:zinc protease
MKIKMSLLLAIIVSFIAINTNAQLKKTAEVEGITEYKMDNGLTVLLFPDNSSQTITVNITYKVGSRYEGYGEKGMAHLLEHMVFKGTPNHKDIPKELTLHGARPNGTTWYDRTNYFETFNATDENLDWALDMEADRMVNSFIAKKDLDSEFSVVRNEFEAGEDRPSGVLMQNVINAAFLWHNYGSSTIGNRSDIERGPIKNLQNFYKKFYRPDNAVLMVTGKFKVEKTLKLIQIKFGDIKNPDIPLSKSYTEEPAQDGEKWVNLSRVGDLQIVSAMYHTPAGSHKDYAAMAIAEEVLTNEPSGRLYKALVDTKKASSLWSFTPFTQEPSFLYINVDVPSEKSLKDAQITLRKVLDDFRNNPVTEEELKRAKANILKGIDEITRNSSYLGIYISEYIGAGDWRLSFIHRDRVLDITLKQVNEVVNKYLIPTNRTVGQFIPTKNPERIFIEHTGDITELVSNYKGKEGYGSGEAFDVSYDNIQQRLISGVLSNGIKYGFIEKDNRGKTINISFALRNGDEENLMNKGVAPGYTAKMLDKGTTTMSRQEIQDQLSQLQASIRFYGSNGKLFASISAKESNLIQTLDLMVDMIRNPKFELTELEKLKTEQLAQIEQQKSDPTSKAYERLNQLLQIFPKGHPLYNMTSDEEIEAINKLSIEDLKSYYRDFYGISNNASIVAIGNINSEKLKDYFEKSFADFKSNYPFTNLSDPFVVNKSANEQINTPDKKNAYTTGVLNFKLSQNEVDYPAMIIAGEILGGGFLSSRLAKRIRQKDGVSYGVGAWVIIDGDKNDKNSSVNIYAIYAPQNAEKVQLGFKEEIARFINDGITEKELKEAIKGWVQAKSLSRAKDRELTSLINNDIYYKRNMSFHKDLEKELTKLTVKQVNKVIKKYFKTLDNWTVVNAGEFKK